MELVQNIDTDLDKLQNIFQSNGYPDRVIKETVTAVRQDKKTYPSTESITRTDRAVLRLPWIGLQSNKFKKEVEEATKAAYYTVQPTVAFTTRHAFSGISKDILPMTSLSSVIYQYLCCCEQQYIGKTSQRLTERIKQHVPNKLLNGKEKRHEKSDSAITKHVKSSPACFPPTESQLSARFRVLTKARGTKRT